MDLQGGGADAWPSLCDGEPRLVITENHRWQVLLFLLGWLVEDLWGQGPGVYLILDPVVAV